MKKCPKCGSRYDDSWGVCLKDNTELSGVFTQANEPGDEPAEKLKEASPDPEAHSGPEKEKPMRKNIELTIGQYWLNKIGILSFVAGFAFFIAYSYQHIGPFAKLALGFGAAAGLILFGKWLEKKKEMIGYAMSLIGGGWALAYFGAYAANHIPAVKVIADPNLGLLAMVFMMSLLMIDLMRYRSQAITSIVYILGFVTAGIGRITDSSLLYAALLTFSLVFVIYRMRWSRLMIFAVLASYATHIAWLGPEILLMGQGAAKFDLAMGRFWLSAGFLTCYWLLFTIAPFVVANEKEEDRRHHVGAATLNNALFAFLMFQEATRVNAEYRFYVAIGIALVSAVAALMAKVFGKKEDLIVTHVMMAVSFFTAAFPLKYSTHWVNIAWLCEIPILMFMGVYFERILYRALGWMLAFIMALKTFVLFGAGAGKSIVPGLPFMTERFLTTSVLVSSFYMAYLVFRYFRNRKKVGAEEAAIARAFMVVATLFYMLLTTTDLGSNFKSLAWAGTAAAFFAVGFVTRDRWFRFSALGLVGLVILRIVFHDMQSLPMQYRIVLFMGMGAALLLASYVYGRIAQKNGGGLELSQGQ